MGGNWVRFKSKKGKRDKILIIFIYCLYTLLVLKNNFIQTCHRHSSVSSPETGHGTAIINFNGFSVAVYCILVIYQKKLSMPIMIL